MVYMMIWPQILVESTLANEPADNVATAERPLAMNEAAFHAFYAETARPLWSFICKTCGKPELADDLLQETYLRFLRASDLKTEAALRKAYLYKIATNLMTDHWRTSAREQRFVVTSHSDEKFHEEAASGQKDTAEAVIVGRDLSQVFQQLKPTERSLLWLAYVEGSEHREIAAALGLKQKSIRVLLFRARQKFAQILKRRGLSPEARP
jgi:RNA polymerase sigma-70 factor (ECF subfamily)